MLHPDPNQCVLSSCCYCKGSFSRQCYGGLVNQLAKRNATEFFNWLPFVPLLLRFRSLRQGWDEPLDNWTSILGDSSLPLSFVLAGITGAPAHILPSLVPILSSEFRFLIFQQAAWWEQFELFILRLAGCVAQNVLALGEVEYVDCIIGLMLAILDSGGSCCLCWALRKVWLRSFKDLYILLPNLSGFLYLNGIFILFNGDPWWLC